MSTITDGWLLGLRRAGGGASIGGWTLGGGALRAAGSVDAGRGGAPGGGVSPVARRMLSTLPHSAHFAFMPPAGIRSSGKS